VFTYFTDDSLVPGSSTIRKVHITELRALHRRASRAIRMSAT
jgi:hypothetical protein